MSEWKNLTDGSFKGFTFHVAVPRLEKGHGVSSDEVSYERKLQVIKRPLVDGAETQDFGRDVRTFTAEVVFFGPTYFEDLKSFEKILNEGTPGTLTLPDESESVLASFQRITKRAEYSNGNTKILSVVWVEAEQRESTFIDSTASGVADALDNSAAVLEAGSKTQSLLESAESTLNANTFLEAVRQFESGLSAARSSVNTVLTLTDGVRNRIAAIDANIRGTLSLIDDAVTELSGLFGNRLAARVAISVAGSFDTATGQRVASYQETDEIETPVDPLDPPVTSPTTSVVVSAIQSEASGKVAIEKLRESIAADRDELLDLSDGRTDDVFLSLTSLIAGMNELAEVVQTSNTTTVLVPLEMSLGEVLFHNGRSVDDVDDVLKRNTHIEDPLVVAQNTVVVL